MFLYRPIVISISSFDTGIAVVYAANKDICTPPHCLSPWAIISSPWPSSPALQQFLRFGTRFYTVSAIDYVSKHHKPAL